MSQEVNPLDMVNVSLPPIANLIVIEDINLGHVVNHRIVEDNKDQDQVSLLAVDNMGMEHVSRIMVNKDLVPVNNARTLIKEGVIQMVTLNVVNIGLPLNNTLELDKMGVVPLTLPVHNIGLAQVIPLAMANRALPQDSTQAMENMALPRGRLLDMATKRLPQVSPLDMAKLNLYQVSQLSQENKIQIQDNPQAIDKIPLGTVNQVAFQNVGMKQGRLQLIRKSNRQIQEMKEDRNQATVR